MKEIHNYAVRLNGGPQGEGKQKRGQIHLFNPNNKLVGIIDFYGKDTQLPFDAQAETGVIHMALPTAQMPVIVDLLRNEKPIYLAWQEKLQNAYLSTSQKPVGEGE